MVYGPIPGGLYGATKNAKICPQNYDDPPKRCCKCGAPAVIEIDEGRPLCEEHFKEERRNNG